MERFVGGHRLPDVLPATALVFAFREGKLLAGDAEAPAAFIPTLAEVDAAGIAGTRHFIGLTDEIPCVAIAADANAVAPAGFAFAGLRSLFLRLPESLLALAGRASQIVEWDRTHRHCGVCGAATLSKTDERAKLCPRCGHVAYPRVSPAMMVLVTRGREMLLARARRFPAATYSALAGFVEPGESIEDCIHREVREEVGIDVADLVYFGSQSWAFPHSLMIAYTAEYAAGEVRPDEQEIVDAQWFAPESLPQLPTKVSVARRLIDATAARLAAAR